MLAKIVPLFATTAADGSVSLWNITEKKLIARWTGATASDKAVPATAIAASADGKQLVSGVENGGITLWNLALPQTLAFEGTTGTAVSRIVVSPSRKLAAVAGVANGKHVVFVRNLENGQLLHTLTGHSAAVTAIAFSADNARLVTGSADKTVRIWNPANAQVPEQLKIEGLTGNVTTVAFISSGNQILTGTADKKLQLWNAADGTVLKEFEGHTGSIVAAGFWPGTQPYSVSADKSVRFWNPADGSQTRAFNHPATPTAAALTPDGQKLAIAGDDKLVRIYQINNGQVLQTLTGHADAPTSVSFSQDDNRLASSTAKGELIVWDVATGRLLESAADTSLTAGVFDFQLDRLLTGDKSGQLAQRPLRFVRHLDGNQQAITSLLFHSNGQTVFATSKDGSFRGYSTANGQQTFATNHGAAINGLAISPNEQVLATAGENNVVRLWQTNGGGFGPQQLSGFPGPVKSVVFSLDGTSVIGGSAGDKPAALAFELQSGALQQRFTQHTQPVTGLVLAGEKGHVLSCDASLLMSWSTHAVRNIPGHGNQVTSLAALPSTPMQVFSGSLDSTTRLWNLTNGQQLRQYNHGGAVTAVAVRPDGQRLASASDNHTAKLWNINGQQIAEMRGDVRRKIQVARATQQQNAAQARVNAAKQQLDAVEKDLPVKTEAAKKADEALAAANKDVTEKTAARDKSMGEKVAAEKAAIEASKAAQTALLAKLRAEADAKAAAEAVQLAQAKSNQLNAAANSAPTNAELKQAATEAAAAVQTAQAEQQKLAAAVQAPTQAAQTAVNAANQATQKVTQAQKPYTDALAALKTSESAQNLASQQQAIAARELEAAKAAVPVAKDAHAKLEAALEAAKKALEETNKLSQEADLAIRSLAFSPDGRLLVTGGEFSSVHTWDGETGTALAAFAGHSAAAGRVAFLDDGAIVSGSTDQSVRVWELNPGWGLERTIGAVDQPQLISHRVTSLDFTSEADRLLVAGGTPSRSGELLVFNVADGDKMAFVRSFAHTNSGHSGGTHYVMTGYDNRLADNGAASDRPGIGSIVSRVRGTNHPETGMPTFVRLNGIYADGPAFLGTAFGPFDSGGEARRNMALNVAKTRLDTRRSLLEGIDNVKRDIDRSKVMNGLDAFDLKYEDPRVVDRHGTRPAASAGPTSVRSRLWFRHPAVRRLGHARRHQGRHGPPRPTGGPSGCALVEDLDLRGQLDDTPLVISGEFGRTPKIDWRKCSTTRLLFESEEVRPLTQSPSITVFSNAATFRPNTEIS